jgi:FkbM family methyltransferase
MKIQRWKFFVNFITKRLFGYAIVSTETIDNFYQCKITLEQTQANLEQTQANLEQTQANLNELNFDLYHAQKIHEILNILFQENVKDDFKIFCAENLWQSKSQLLQDLIAAYLQRGEGFFCEIGAADGFKLSNTYLLEKNYRWDGIIAEPARYYKEKIQENRNCIISLKCLYSSSRTLIQFNETLDPLLSTLDDYSQNDIHGKSRENGTRYEVETITLSDLLKESHAPNYIDYLSIDTEGSEYEILKDFDFQRYFFGFITVEHNYSNSQEKVYELLTKNGYKRIMTSVSLWDDFYIAENLLSRIFL